MAIISPVDLPVVLHVQSDPIKDYVFKKLGHPRVEVELAESQLETVIRVSGDFIAEYFPKEERYALFYTSPLKSTYPMPADAYWIRSCDWDPSSTNIGDIFGAESYLFNIGNVTGITNILTDYHLLQAYRKFSRKILGTEGHWEVVNEVNGESNQQLIRLYPTPKGAFPVVVRYLPFVTYFRSPQAKMICYEMIEAEAKLMLGHARRKLTGMPTPDGGGINYDGDQLVQEGQKMKDEIIQKAINLGEPSAVFLW